MNSKQHTKNNCEKFVNEKEFNFAIQSMENKVSDTNDYNDSDFKQHTGSFYDISSVNTDQNLCKKYNDDENFYPKESTIIKKTSIDKSKKLLFL